MALLQATRVTGSVSGTSNGLEVVRPNEGGGPPGVFTYGSNDLAFRNKNGESYLNNAPTEAYFYSQNLPVSIYATAARRLQVTNNYVGVGDVPDANGRLYVYGAGTTSNFLSIANCNAFKTTSTTGYTFAGFIGIYINASVNGFATAAGTYYFPIYSKP